MFKYFSLLFIIISLMSCAKTEDEKIRSAVQEAKYHLNSMNCTKAKEVLDDIGFQTDHGDYISIYASAYACMAGYKELELFENNLSKLNSASLMQSLATFDTSNEISADSNDIQNIHLAITTLIGNDGAAQPSTAARNTKFGSAKSGDMSLQALYLIFVAMGKHFQYFGNADTNSASPNYGKKGFGATVGHDCIGNYTNADAVAYINANPQGTCAGPLAGTEGSADLDAPETTADIKMRLCRGIIYYNNMIDILGNINIPGSTELGDIANIRTALNLLMTAGELIEAGYNTDAEPDPSLNTNNSIAALKVITDQASCEAQPMGRLQKFNAIFFESIYQ